jgi:hypothetical protein
VLLLWPYYNLTFRFDPEDLEQPAERLLVDEGRAGHIVGIRRLGHVLDRLPAQTPSASMIRRAAAVPEYCC